VRRHQKRPKPPHPGLVRRPSGSFGWLEARLLHDDWLARCGPNASAALLLLALAADRTGSSFYGRERMAAALSLDRDALARALGRLLELRLVAFRPWSPGHRDGVWQLLPPPATRRRTSSAPMSVGEILAQLGLGPPASEPPA
jgi:hypothetical protein